MTKLTIFVARMTMPYYIVAPQSGCRLEDLRSFRHHSGAASFNHTFIRTLFLLFLFI